MHFSRPPDQRWTIGSALILSTFVLASLPAVPFPVAMSVLVAGLALILSTLPWRQL